TQASFCSDRSVMNKAHHHTINSTRRLTPEAYVVEIPPPEEGRRIVERPARHREPGSAKLGLKAETPGRPFRGTPDGDEDDQQNEGDLPPQDTASGHRGSNRLGE
ncbi:hypothetical protein, partial [Acetobacter lovaniensis]